MSDHTITPVANIENDNDLPHHFDLFYDIKTVDALHAHLTGKQRCATSATDAELVQSMIKHKIRMPEGYVPAALLDVTAVMIAGLLIKKVNENSVAVDLPDGGQVIITLEEEAVDVKILAQKGECIDIARASYGDLEPD